MLAQYQMMGARAQQQELVQQQLAEYERARQEEESYRNLATQQGFDPLSRQSLVQAYQISPTLGMKVLSAQEQAKAHAAMAANQASDASIRQQRFQAELPTLLAGAGKAKTEQAMADLTMTRDLAAGVLQTGKGFDKLKEHIKTNDLPNDLISKNIITKQKSFNFNSSNPFENIFNNNYIIAGALISLFIIQQKIF
jgi:hypothetical protein